MKAKGAKYTFNKNIQTVNWHAKNKLATQWEIYFTKGKTYRDLTFSLPM